MTGTIERRIALIEDDVRGLNGRVDKLVKVLEVQGQNNLDFIYKVALQVEQERKLERSRGWQ